MKGIIGNGQRKGKMKRESKESEIKGRRERKKKKR